MTVFVALLRAVNVAGTGMLKMPELAALCVGLGFGRVRTYIQSGNVVFEARGSEAQVRAALEQALTAKMGKPIDVMIRTPAELEAILKGNPFPEGEPARVCVVFRHEAVSEGLAQAVLTPTGEEVRAGRRELYVHFVNGQARSKIKYPKAMGPATVRNINTVGKLAEMGRT
jgi:uncharacterized protein (DUF1697 family)